MSLILAGIIPAVLGLTHLLSFLFFLAVFVSGYCISNVHVHQWLAGVIYLFYNEGEGGQIIRFDLRLEV